MRTLNKLKARMLAKKEQNAARRQREHERQTVLQSVNETTLPTTSSPPEVTADHGLTFSALRLANQSRIPEFRNGRGELAHSQADGSDWSKAEWLEAVVGELGEYANLAKKIRRGDYTESEAREAVTKELADVQVYLDILAMQWGVDLGAAVLSKFNEVSERVGATTRIKPDGQTVVTRDLTTDPVDSVDSVDLS